MGLCLNVLTISYFTGELRVNALDKGFGSVVSQLNADGSLDSDAHGSGEPGEGGNQLLCLIGCSSRIENSPTVQRDLTERNYLT